MHHSTKRRVFLGMTTGGLLVGGLGMGVAQADASAAGGAAGSPGLLSGNVVQVPIDAPVNVCGNSISVIGILDTAAGNTCSNTGGNGATARGGAADSPGAASGNLVQVPVDAPVNVCGNSVSGVGVGDGAYGDKCSNSGPGDHSGTGGTTATGGTHGSPGLGSGNTVQVPVQAPVNACGNSVSVIGVGDTAAGDSCSNGTPSCKCQPTPPAPPAPPATSGTPAVPAQPQTPAPGRRVSTGVPALAETGSGASGLLAPLGAGMLGGGGLLLRKRVGSRADAVARERS